MLKAAQLTHQRTRSASRSRAAGYAAAHYTMSAFAVLENNGKRLRSYPKKKCVSRVASSKPCKRSVDGHGLSACTLTHHDCADLAIAGKCSADVPAGPVPAERMFEH